MNTAVINFTTEPKLKVEAQKTARKLGISLSLVLNSYLKQFIQTKTVTFSDKTPSMFLKDSIRKSRKQLKKGEASPTFNDVEDAIAYLHKKSA